MPRLLKDLHIDDVSSVTAGEGRGVKVLLMKSNTQEDSVQVLNIEDVRKAHSDGRMSNSNVFKLFNDTLRKLQVEGESEGETLSRCTNWRDVRYNKKFHYLFDFVNELERVGKAAPANGPYGHGTVTSNSRSFDANSDEGEKIASVESQINTANPSPIMILRHSLRVCRRKSASRSPNMRPATTCH